MTILKKRHAVACLFAFTLRLKFQFQSIPGCLVAPTAAAVVALLIALLVTLAIDPLVLILVAQAAGIAAVGMFVVAVLRRTETVPAGAIIPAIVQAVLVAILARVSIAATISAVVTTVPRRIAVVTVTIIIPPAMVTVTILISVPVS